MVAILAPVLDRLGLGLRPARIFQGELVVSALFVAVAAVRRHGAPPLTARGPGWQLRTLWRPRAPHERNTYLMLLVALPLMTILASLGFLTSPLDSSMTEFYVLGRDGFVADYPYKVAAGDQVTVTLGVANRAGAAATYHFEVWEGGAANAEQRRLILASATFELQPGAVLQRPVSWQMTRPGDDQLVELFLFQGGDTTPSRELRLWMTVGA